MLAVAISSNWKLAGAVITTLPLKSDELLTFRVVVLASPVTSTPVVVVAIFSDPLK